MPTSHLLGFNHRSLRYRIRHPRQSHRSRYPHIDPDDEVGNDRDDEVDHVSNSENQYEITETRRRD